MTIFPFIDGLVESESTPQTSLPMAREYAWDFEKNDFIFDNGRHVIVEGVEAVKVWAHHVIKIERYRYLALSWNIGTELDTLIGSRYTKGVIESESKRMIREALLINPYITDIRDFKVTFEKDVLTIICTLDTIYGEVIMNV